MKRYFRWIGIALGVIGLIVLALVLELLRHGGQFRPLRPHFAGTCTTIPLDASAEDIQIDRERGIAYLSYLDRRQVAKNPDTTGTVMLLDLSSAEPRPRAALSVEPEYFRPHGMSLYVPPNGGPRRLFVISHPRGKHEVVIFEQSITGAFSPMRTIRDPLLHHPNAVVAVGPDQFYVANDSGARNGFQRFLEIALRVGLSKLVYFDGEEMRVADSGLKSASGIAASPDFLRLYVSETTGNRVRIYKRDVIRGNVLSIETVPLRSAPDNINVDEHGTAWIAAHARLSALVRHFANPENPAPTQVFALRAEGDPRLTEVFLDRGDRISAGSVAAVTGQRMLIGSITEKKVLSCSLPAG